MKILAISDQVNDSLYSSNLKKRFGDVQFIIGCGDLPYTYLEYIVSMLDVPLYYVPGNHDPVYKPSSEGAHAEGCENIDGRVVKYRNCLISGLGGSIRYRPDGVNQYSQMEMYRKVQRLIANLNWNRFVHKRITDIFVAHSPPYGIHDDDDLAHTGFHAFIHLIHQCKPRYFLHGHTFFYKTNIVSPITQLDETQIINVYPYRVIELDCHDG